MENGFPSSPAQEICLFQGSHLEAELNLVLLHPGWGHMEGPQRALAQTCVGEWGGLKPAGMFPVLAARESLAITVPLQGHAQ